MELLQLKYFLVAAEYQHITRAADALQIAQPALSQAIHRLEAELGVQLFDRRSRSIELNANGRRLQKRLIPIMAALASIPEELREGADEADRTIHLQLSAASTLITNCIILYRSQHPDVNFQFYQSGLHQDYDLHVTAVRADLPDIAEENCRVMMEEELFLAVPSSSPYSNRSSIRLAETVDEGYICLAGSRPIRKISNSYFSELGITPHVIFESDSTEAVKNLIAAGLGIGFWPEHSWGALSTTHVRLLPIEDLNCRRRIILITPKKSRDNPLVTDFCDFLIETARYF